MLRHGTVAADVPADLVTQVARVLEARAADAQWSSSVTLADGFAEDAARAAVRKLPDVFGAGEVLHRPASVSVE